MIDMEKDKLFKQLIAEKLDELVHEIEGCFDGRRVKEIKRQIEACHVLLGSKINIRKYYAN